MPSFGEWKYAAPPNYDRNVNKIYPYSEVPFLGEYNLVKIPVSSYKLVDHIDYWGEGRIVVTAGCSGFTDCYNINHVHQVVSNGPDADRKIPNRIPVVSYTNCDTSSYIKNNSVELITVMGAPINTSCAEDIGRIINNDVGKVVVFGFEEASAYIKNLENELTKKALLYCEDFSLPSKLLDLTLFDNHRAYLNLTDMSDYLYKNIVDKNYEKAVCKSKLLQDSNNGSIISDTVGKLLKEGQQNIWSYAYKLWNSNAKSLITNYFPQQFQAIFNGDYVMIVNKSCNEIRC
ncbi:unnamed protein product [Parnassius mnemosyne]|uniref:Uncharacterized protein n=1 Tax=Parnassius mnemosyne TaxID=213953 RepID=A0AAV1L5K9_9NEOP